jgi:hypothetical protein
MGGPGDLDTDSPSVDFPGEHTMASIGMSRASVNVLRVAMLVAALLLADARLHPAGAVLIRQSLAGSVSGSFPMKPTLFEQLWDAGYGLAGSIRFRVVPRFHVNVEVAYYRHLSDNAAFREFIAQQRSNVNLSGYDLWILPVSLVAELDLLERGTTKPFLLFGAGYYNFGTTDAALSGLGSDQVVLPDAPRDAFGLQAGLGVRTPVALGVTLFLDASYHVSFTESERTAFLPIRAGLQF